MTKDNKKNEISVRFLEEIRRLSESVNKFSSDYQEKYQTLVYNPLEYAFEGMSAYVSSYLMPSARVVLLGMNPGPFGMAQTGVPFGDVTMVRDWMGIRATIAKPVPEHPKRPISGFECKRSEVSGTRLWGWAKDRHGAPGNFFKHYFVWNYCPLVFMEESGANRTPDKIDKIEQKVLFDLCNQTLKYLVDLLNPECVIGVGKFAMKRAESAVGERVKISDILHPSPASPKANRNWRGEIEGKLSNLACLF